MNREPLGVVGGGVVGLVTTACFAELGHRVTLYDIQPTRVTRLEAGDLPVYEPVLSEVLAHNRTRVTYTHELADVLGSSDIVFVCVGTPSTPSGDADLTGIWDLLADLPALEGRRLVLVIRSTVPVGTCGEARAGLDARGLGHVDVVSNPEFLAQGTAVLDFAQPDRIVIGASTEAAGERVAALYEPFDAPIVRTDLASAEMIKLASNAALVTRISFINEIANVCELVGANIDDVARGIGLDSRLGPHFLQAGVGFGGSCFPKDALALKQLAANSGYDFQLLSAVIVVNELQRARVLEKLRAHLGELRGTTIALLGLAFKPHTNDTRESPSLALAPHLRAEGATVRVWDPVAVEDARGFIDLELTESMLAAVEGADAAVVVTDWPELQGLPCAEVRESMRTPLIVDGRNAIDPTVARRAGFVYEGFGRPAEHATSPARGQIKAHMQTS